MSRLEGDRTLFGLAVPKAVGGAVIRNAVKRRLRAIIAESLEGIPPGRAILVRALPPAAQASYNALRNDLREATIRVLEKGAS